LSIIRVASTDDLVQIQRIEVNSYPDPWPRSIFYLMHGRAPELFLVADNSGEVIGYIVGEIELLDDHIVGHVLNIAVTKSQQRKGNAEALLDELELRFRERGSKVAYLEVRLGNTAAQNLYKKHGYRKLELLPGYYRTEDGISMEKPLL
jgi:[ribosomal protein S18]-alanine N-acetyltransferase